MTVAATLEEPFALPGVPDAVRASIVSTFFALWGERPTPSPLDTDSASSVVGIISFAGDVCCSVSLVLTQEAAPAMVHAFTGMEIPFDSPDMGDAVGELVNVLAGEIVAQLESRRIKVRMGLPIVARGCPLEVMVGRNSKVLRFDYLSKHGTFWLVVVSPSNPATLRR